MRTRSSRKATSVLALAALGAVVVACETTAATEDTSPALPSGIRPQPQPTKGEASFTSPCTAEACGEAPVSLTSPRCKPVANGCGWSEDSSVSYRTCEESACGTAPGPNVCPAGTTFKANTCGAEKDGPCGCTTAWGGRRCSTGCTTLYGCGAAKPELGVVCSDGGIGDLACMKFIDGCRWQPTCD